MWKLVFIPLLFTLMTPSVHAIPAEPKAVERWIKNLVHAKPKVSKFHFYFHDIIGGKSPTVVPVAQANSTAKSPTFFGGVNVIDDPLTAGPEQSSKVIGRAQGLYAMDGLEEFSLVMAINIVFTDGVYNGSSLSILGHNPVFHEYREMPIIGGSGVFRLARGIATAKTHSIDPTVAVVEYHVVAIHY